MSSYRIDKVERLIKEEVSTEIPRSYEFVDVVTFSEGHLREYCRNTISRYRKKKTANSGEVYENIFSSFLRREAEILGH